MLQYETESFQASNINKRALTPLHGSLPLQYSHMHFVSRFDREATFAIIMPSQKIVRLFCNRNTQNEGHIIYMKASLNEVPIPVARVRVDELTDPSEEALASRG